MIQLRNEERKVVNRLSKTSNKRTTYTEDNMEMFTKALIFFGFCVTLAVPQAISFAPPAPVQCADDPDMKEFCVESKKKGYCSSKVEIMELACAKTCEFCPKDTFSKDIEDIIKDQKKIQKAAGGEDTEKIKQGLKEGKGSPTAEGDFKGKGKTDAEKEATEVPEKEGDKAKNEDENGGKKPKKEGKGKEDDKKPEKEVKEPDLGGGDNGDVGSTSGCDKKCQTECLEAHNKYRANHGAPPLKWDKTLADQAQVVADKNAASNQFEHSDWAAGKGGECIGWGPIKPSWLINVKDWHDEEENYDYNTGKSKNGKAIGHFTQVVWKKAKKLGCAMSEMTMYGSKGPFYIAQMDVVGIVQSKEELDLVGKPKENDIDWFKGLREKQMNEKRKGQKKSQQKLGKVISKAHVPKGKKYNKTI